MPCRIFGLVVVAAFCAPRTAAADWIISPYIGAGFARSSNFLVGRETTENNKLTFGSSAGFLTDGVLGVEADVGFVPGFFTGQFVSSSMITTVMGNIIVAAPLEVAQYGLRPYVIGGAGLLRARGDDPVESVIASNLFGLNVGGGAIGPVSPRTSLRFDVRYFRNLGDDPEALTVVDQTRVKLSFWRGTVGLTFRF